MPSDCISFKDTGFFSDLICNYLEQKKSIASLYHRFPTLENFKLQIEEKQVNFSNENRIQLVKSLQQQYTTINVSEKTKHNIEQLKSSNTFTITTGHQLNLFTGPLYFLYKIISTINLTEELKTTYPSYNFVPVYWMATEDHDFVEINNFTLKGEKIVWNKEDALDNKKGAVGEFNTEGLADIFSLLEKDLGVGKNASFLKDLFKKGYLEHENLTEATRYIVNELFAAYGLVIVDGNDAGLKSLFIPVLEEELKNKTSFTKVSETVIALEKLDYKAQVTPREINLFYLAKDSRERIILNENGSYSVNDTNTTWDSYKSIQKELKNHPERFSPNVILRPVFQEVILPNLCYIGGGGELAYWFELKSTFQAFNIPFPILLLRNSALLISKKEQEKLNKLSINNKELFLKQHKLINKKVREISDIEIDFSEQKKALRKQFKDLEELALKTDKSFLNAVKAQETKQIKGLNVLEKRLLKAQRIKLNDKVDRLTKIHNQLFPQQSLQERKLNFSEFYLEYGQDLIPKLKEELKPLSLDFSVISL